MLLEFELTYYNITVQHMSHYTKGIPPKSSLLASWLAHAFSIYIFHIFITGLKSGLSDGYSDSLTLLSLSHFATTLKICIYPTPPLCYGWECDTRSIFKQSKPDLNSEFSFLTGYSDCLKPILS